MKYSGFVIAMLEFTGLSLVNGLAMILVSCDTLYLQEVPVLLRTYFLQSEMQIVHSTISMPDTGCSANWKLVLQCMWVTDDRTFIGL